MLQRILPAVMWLKAYKKEDLPRDLSAGIIVGIMLVPQGMAYAMLAGLDPVIGLYAATIPLIIYAMFGSSRQLAVGPVAIVSLLVFTGVSGLAEPGSEQYLSLAILLALMVGALQFAMGLLRLGLLVNFLSHAVIKGFTSAAAIIIAVSQLKHLLGTELPADGTVFAIMLAAVRQASDIHLLTVAIGIAAVAILVACKRWLPRFPAHMVVVAAGLLAVYAFQLENKGTGIVGPIPKGLPAFSLPPLDIESMMALLPVALTIAFVGFLESIAIAKTIAAKEKYKIDSNRELNGLGLANLIGSLFSAFPVTGSFSRSAVNYQAGARTALASLITAVFIILTLLFLTPLFYYLPKVILAAIIMVAVYGLLDVRGAVQLYRIKKVDGLTLLFTFICTLVIGIEQGLLLGIAFSLLVFIWRSAYPNTVELGYLLKENVYRSVSRYPEARTYPDVLILRMDAPLYFANMSFLEERISEEISKKQRVEWVILDFSGVNDMDAVAVHDLEDLMDNYRKAGVRFLLAGMKGPVAEVVKAAGWTHKYGEAINCMSIRHAVTAIEESNARNIMGYYI